VRGGEAAGGGLDVVSIGARGGSGGLLVTMLGANGLCGMPRRRTTLGYWPDAEPLAISLRCGTPVAARRRVSDSAAWRGRLFGVTPSGPSYYGTA